MFKMAESTLNSSPNIISFRDLTDRVDIVIEGVGTYIIGLSANGSIIIEQNEDNICMSLLVLTHNDNGGCTLSPVNNDLPCHLNSAEEPLSGEVHLIDGSTIEMADKKLKFFNGPIPKRRRKLPRTPGTMVGEPPTKPGRRHVQAETVSANPDIKVDTADTNLGAGEDITDTIQDNDADVEADKRWLEASWCMLDLPESDQYMFKDLYTPEQISIIAASYFTKQLRMFTDATITEHFLDNIFRLFMDTIAYCREAYMDYLSDISRALAKIPDRSNTRPMHGPAVKFLTELLKQCLDPVDKVVLILDLLRTFSHFDMNLDKMIRWQTSAAVLGSMSAYVQHLEVQQHGMDILAKLATFKPTIEKKTPVREVAVDMIARAVKFHSSDLPLARSSCRALANLSSTLIAVLSQTLESVSPTTDGEICGFINKYEELLEYIFKDGIPFVQTLMKTFVSDIGVNTEGRRFIFYYVKLPQLQLKKTKWMTEASQRMESDEEIPKAEDELQVNGDHDKEAMDTETEKSENFESDPEFDVQKPESTSSDENMEMQLNNDDARELSKPYGILKKVGSYENLRTPERRLGFREGTVGGSDSDTETFTSVSDAECDGSLMFSLPKQRDSDENFNSNFVKHWVRKTIKRRCNANGEDFDDSESETEHEFLTSLDKAPSISAYNGDVENSCKEVIDYNDLEETPQHRAISKDLDSAESERMETVSDSTVKGAHEAISSQSVSSLENDRLDGAEKTLQQCVTSDMKHSAIKDVVYLGKLVRTQIITHVGSLVFRGEDSMVLMVIDKSIKTLLEDAAAPLGLIAYAGNQYGSDLTLMDLEPAIVISVIDAVRYRSVTTELVQSAVLSLTRSISAALEKETVNTTMLFFKSIFSDQNLKTIITDKEFLKEFRICFQNATERMEKSHTIEEIRNSLGSQSFVV